MAGTWDQRPKLREMLIHLSPRSALMLGFLDDISPFLRREWPPDFLWLSREMRVLKRDGWCSKQ
jgi:hypothetical protein